MDINSQIKSNYGRVFRRAKIKRKSATTGLFESTWQDVSADVKSWGKVRKQIDDVRFGALTFGDINMVFDNTLGRYNPEDDEFSRWYGYGSQQRTLVRIEAGFLHQTLSAGGIWQTTEYPTSTSVFHGIISGDIPLTGQNVVTVPVRPLLQIFKDYPARNLTGFTSTGLTASQFMGIVRDQTDGAGSFVFRPFFGDTTTNWNITATTNVYTQLNTATAEDVFGATVWEIMEKLLEAENMVVYIKRDGSFNFTTRDAGAASAFHFFGAGFADRTHGHTIKRVARYGKKQTDFYTRVEVKFRSDDTLTSFRVQETAFTVTGSNDAWNRGHRTYKFENLWVANTAAADVILSTIYNNVTVLKDQIEFVSTFVPHLEVLDRITMSYDSGPAEPGSRWDLSDWAAEDTTTASDLFWSKSGGDAIFLVARDFKTLSIELDLDKLETKISAVTA